MNIGGKYYKVGDRVRILCSKSSLHHGHVILGQDLNCTGVTGTLTREVNSNKHMCDQAILTVDDCYIDRVGSSTIILKCDDDIELIDEGEGREDMQELDKRISETINRKLSDGTVELLVEKSLEKAVSESISSIFSYSGDGRKIIQDKLNTLMIPIIEGHDFNKYLVKLDSVLTEIINGTTLDENKIILENFKRCMKEPTAKEINISDIFEEYKRHVSENVDTSDLHVCHDGDDDPYYDNVQATMEVEYLDGWSLDQCKVILTCEQDEKLNMCIELYKRKDKTVWSFRHGQGALDIYSLRYLSEFEVFISTLYRAFVNIHIDTEYECDDEIEPNEKPEWSFS